MTPVVTLSSKVRAYLEWSWNYAMAEGLQEELTKGLARAIAAGIVPGADASDHDLVYDYLENRVGDRVAFLSSPIARVNWREVLDQPTDWWGNNARSDYWELVFVKFVAELRNFPGLAEMVRELDEDLHDATDLKTFYS